MKRWCLIVCGLLMALPVASSTALDPPPIFVLRWGEYGLAPGQFQHPHGMAVDPEGNIYVTDTWNQRIQKFDAQGHLLGVFGSAGSGPGQLARPRDVAVGPDRNVYVTDSNHNRIQVFSPSGEPLRSWGSHGYDPGEFSNPRGIAVDDSGNVFVADFSRVQKFTSEGAYLSQFGSPGSGVGELRRPTDIEIDAFGFIYVVDHGNLRIQKFRHDGTFVLMWGNHEQFQYLYYIATDASGNVYVTDPAVAYQVLKFDGSGTLLSRWGTGEQREGDVSGASGIAVDPQGDIYVAQPWDFNLDVRGQLLHVVQKFSYAPTATRQESWGSLKHRYR